MRTRELEQERRARRGGRARERNELQRVAMVGTYLPRRCGIATFTSDLCEALAGEYADLQLPAIAMNDVTEGYQYPERVRFEIKEDDIESYRRAADFLELGDVDVLCVQHEFGIFGGEGGAHVVELLQRLRMPIVTTCHTVYETPPSAAHDEVFRELLALSDRVIVLSRRASTMLTDIHGVPAEKIDHVPHGIHDVPFVDPSYYKDELGLAGKRVILTFGLLGPNKGIEHVIRALPRIVSRHEHVRYVVLGATHPFWVNREGESYRERLNGLCRELNVEEYVQFYNRFVGLRELLTYIGASDIYITPYLDKQQVSSGTLAYALGSGKAVLSTPYWYAEELLADERGKLVPFSDHEAIARDVVALLDEPVVLDAMRKRAYLHGREMTWSKVARLYMRAFSRAREERTRQPRLVSRMASTEARPADLPSLSLGHLRRLTDGTGVVSSAIHTVPDLDSGYRTEDNARALALTARLSPRRGDPGAGAARELASTYLAFLWHAFDEDVRRFKSSMTVARQWSAEPLIDEVHGHAIAALGVVAGRSEDEGLSAAATKLFDAAMPALLELDSMMAWARGLVGINEYLRRFYGDHHAQSARVTLAERLMARFRSESTDDWPLPEEEATCSHAVLAHALIVCGRWIPSSEMVETGLKALAWLTETQRGGGGCFSPIGDHGFWNRNGERAMFRQRPVDVEAMVCACLSAYQARGDRRWLVEARRAFDWFLGRNDVGLPLYDGVSRGCRDALHPDRTNANQGASATLAFLLSLAELRAIEGARVRGG